MIKKIDADIEIESYDLKGIISFIKNNFYRKDAKFFLSVLKKLLEKFIVRFFREIDRVI